MFSINQKFKLLIGIIILTIPTYSFAYFIQAHVNDPEGPNVLVQRTNESSIAPGGFKAEAIYRSFDGLFGHAEVDLRFGSLKAIAQGSQCLGQGCYVAITDALLTENIQFWGTGPLGALVTFNMKINGNGTGLAGSVSAGLSVGGEFSDTFTGGVGRTDTILTGQVHVFDNIIYNILASIIVTASPMSKFDYGNSAYLSIDMDNGISYSSSSGVFLSSPNVSSVPIPATAFMFAPALLGFLGLRRKAKT